MAHDVWWFWTTIWVHQMRHPSAKISGQGWIGWNQLLWESVVCGTTANHLLGWSHHVIPKSKLRRRRRMRRPQVAATSWSESNQWPYLGCCICGMTNCTNWSTPCTMHDLCALVGPKEYLENIMTKIIQIILEKRFFVVWFLSHKSMPATSPYHIPVHPIVVYTCIPVRQLWLR